MGISRRWKATMQQGIANDAWDAYDALIQKTIAAYEARFNGTPDWPPPHWLMVKAMVWNESGGPGNPAWTRRTMQIGNKGDPAYAVLRHKKEGADLIMAAQLAEAIDTGKIDDPHVNIRAGIAYLLTRMARFGTSSVPDPKDTESYTYTVVSGDSLERIAKKAGTTELELKADNPDVGHKPLEIGQTLNYRKASMEQVITGWRPFDTRTVADKYNGGGDPYYAAKLDYLLKDVFPKIKRTKVSQK